MNIYYAALIVIVLVIILNQLQYKIPKIAWSYWDKNTPPIIEKIIEERKKAMSDWKIILLTDKTIKEYIDMNSTPKGYDNLKPQHQADWIRLKLLEKYGGLWLDSSIIVNEGEAINEIYNSALARRPELIAFTLNKPKSVEYIENWFIMAPTKSHLIRKWLREYEKAISMGFEKYRAYVLGQNITISKDIYTTDPKNVYLTQHACIQVVLKQLGVFCSARVLLYPAERNMFKIHTDCKWNSKCIIDKISNGRDVKSLPFIKLRGGEKIIDYERYFSQ
jgi:hypothetical protein